MLASLKVTIHCGKFQWFSCNNFSGNNLMLDLLEETIWSVQGFCVVCIMKHQFKECLGVSSWNLAPDSVWRCSLTNISRHLISIIKFPTLVRQHLYIVKKSSLSCIVHYSLHIIGISSTRSVVAPDMLGPGQLGSMECICIYFHIYEWFGLGYLKWHHTNMPLQEFID